jgi:hypothetical protein
MDNGLIFPYRFWRDHDEPGDANRPKPGRVFGSGLVERGTRTGSSQAMG